MGDYTSVSLLDNVGQFFDIAADVVNTRKDVRVWVYPNELHGLVIHLTAKQARALAVGLLDAARQTEEHGHG